MRGHRALELAAGGLAGQPLRLHQLQANLELLVSGTSQYKADPERVLGLLG